MTVYELRKELEKWPQDSKVMFCVATDSGGWIQEGCSHWFEELQESDLAAGDKPGTVVLAR